MIHYIHSKGYALSSLPGIIVQTVAGINGPNAEGGMCPTGDYKGKILSDNLDMLRVVVPDIKHVPVRVDSEPGAPHEYVDSDDLVTPKPIAPRKPIAGAVDIDKNHPWFGGFRLSFGYLGVISEVRYKLQPKYWIKSVEFPTEKAVELGYGDYTGFDWVIHHGKEWFLKHEFARIMLWPFLMECDVWGANVSETEVHTPGGNPWNWSLLLNWIVNALLYFASHAYWFVPTMMELGVLRKREKVEYSDDWFKVLPLEQGLNRRPLKHRFGMSYIQCKESRSLWNTNALSVVAVAYLQTCSLILLATPRSGFHLNSLASS